jgi:hypothetical protein
MLIVFSVFLRLYALELHQSNITAKTYAISTYIIMSKTDKREKMYKPGKMYNLQQVGKHRGFI